MTPIGKDITKRNKIACSSMSYTLFVFYTLMLLLCFFASIIHLQNHTNDLFLGHGHEYFLYCCF